ncbi:MAG: hypothetical protein ACOY5Y_05320 [Pseudomonadota bacterium]
MLSRIDRTHRAILARAERLERAERPRAGNILVPVEPVQPARAFRDERRRGPAEFTAQMIGQDGQRRGLRAGPASIDAAHSAYKRIEWSGPYDRRAAAGRYRREEV